MLLHSKQMQQEVQQEAEVLPVVEQQEGAVEEELQPLALPVQEPQEVKQQVQVVQPLPVLEQVEMVDQQAVVLELLPEQVAVRVQVRVREKPIHTQHIELPQIQAVEAAHYRT
jgi:hypothetical protein